jgi:hypothetical protein
MDVIPDGEFRKIQVSRDFFVCETSGDERDQSLLAQSKIGL